MSSWTVWIPAIALAVIVLIGYRRLATATGSLSHRGARIAALQVAVAFVLLTGASSAAGMACVDGARRCSDCTYDPWLQTAWIFGEECEDFTWYPAGGPFFGDGDEGNACADAGEQCGVWTTE